MKRYYLSKIKQVTDPILGELAWKHRLQEYAGVDFTVATIQTNAATGTPVHPFVLALVGGIDHKQFKDDPELIAMPAVAHDTKVSAIHTATKLACKQRIRQLGHSQAEVDEVWNNADGLRDVLLHYGRLNDPAFDVNDFDIDES
jgi:hypothetical protein